MSAPSKLKNRQECICTFAAASASTLERAAVAELVFERLPPLPLPPLTVVTEPRPAEALLPARDPMLCQWRGSPAWRGCDEEGVGACVALVPVHVASQNAERRCRAWWQGHVLSPGLRSGEGVDPAPGGRRAGCRQRLRRRAAAAQLRQLRLQPRHTTGSHAANMLSTCMRTAPAARFRSQAPEALTGGIICRDCTTVKVGAVPTDLLGQRRSVGRGPHGRGAGG
jgi:hypothetical protein